MIMKMKPNDSLVIVIPYSSGGLDVPKLSGGLGVFNPTKPARASTILVEALAG